MSQGLKVRLNAIAGWVFSALFMTFDYEYINTLHQQWMLLLVCIYWAVVIAAIASFVKELIETKGRL